MSIDPLLSRLEKVRATGPGRWIARCPAHQDKGPSLSIRQLDDGRSLLHCFAGCATADVLAAIGFEMADLFPERLDNAKPERHPFHAMDILRALTRESLIVQAAGQFILEGRALSEADHERLQVAVERIQQAVSFAGVSHYG